jgi:uncharacterized protein (DUF1800 family)
MPVWVVRLFTTGMRPVSKARMRLVSGRLVSLGFVSVLACRSAPVAVPEQPVATPPPPGLTASPLTTEQKAFQALSRLSYGPRPGDVGRLVAGGDATVWSFVEEQLAGATLDDPSLDARLAELDALKMSIPELQQRFVRLNEVAKERGVDLGNPAARQALLNQIDPDHLLRVLDEQVMNQKLITATEGRRQLQAVLVDFWFNHFNVNRDKGPVHWMVLPYERDAIRPHVYGRFRDMLGAVAHHPAMLFYLDNWASVRERPPDPRRPNQPGLNENYARELMELHTLGVNGGYTQQDVREAARCLTGWSIDRPQKAATFIFRPRAHDEGEKVVLGLRFASGGGEGDGEKLLDMLAGQPATAHFLSLELARFFVSDDPPPALVDRLAQTYLATDGNLSSVYRVLFGSEEFWSQEAYRAKVKSPLIFAVSAVRALDGHVDNAVSLAAEIGKMGEPLYQCQPPTGYRDEAQAWVNTGALVTRLSFGLRLAAGKVGGVHGRLLPLSSGRLSSDPSVFIDRAGLELLHGDLTPPTREVLLVEFAPEQRTMPDGEVRPLDTGKLAGLIIGSPEFQRR